MLVTIAIADAYGAGFEYAPKEFVQENNTLARYVQNPSHTDLSPGRYTDDTQMSIAVAKALLSGKLWTKELLADHFVQAFKRDPRPGYSKKFYEILQQVKDGAELQQKIDPVSTKCGAAMRAAPIGLLRHRSDVVNYSIIQASVTHDTDEGRMSSVAVSLAVFYLKNGFKPSSVSRLIAEDLHHAQRIDQINMPVDGQGWSCVDAALEMIDRHNKISSLIKDCVSLTGDVDTVAAITAAMASVSPFYENDLLPDDKGHTGSVLYHALEIGRPYGVAFLQDLDKRLSKSVA